MIIMLFIQASLLSLILIVTSTALVRVDYFLKGFMFLDCEFIFHGASAGILV